MAQALAILRDDYEKSIKDKDHIRTSSLHYAIGRAERRANYPNNTPVSNPATWKRDAAYGRGYKLLCCPPPCNLQVFGTQNGELRAFGLPSVSDGDQLFCNGCGRLASTISQSEAYYH